MREPCSSCHHHEEGLNEPAARAISTPGGTRLHSSAPVPQSSCYTSHPGLLQLVPLILLGSPLLTTAWPLPRGA